MTTWERIQGGIGADDKFWEALAEGEFKLPRCASCGTWLWPARERCPECGTWDPGWDALDPVGTVFAWTRTHYAFDRVIERADDVPYTVALVEVDGAGGARVFGIFGSGDDDIKVGARVRGEILPPSEKAKGYPSIRWVIAEA